MNVLEAIEKMSELETQINTLVKVIKMIDEDSRFDNYELDIINKMKNEIVKERDILKDRLSKTQLTITR